MADQRSRHRRLTDRRIDARQFSRAARHYIWRQWIRPIAPVVLIVMTFRGAVADWNDVPTPSMYPTIEVGDRIFVNKLAYGLRIPLTNTWLAMWSEPQRGEISVLFSPTEGKCLVKRVVGLPGDEIAMRDNRLFINGIPMDYSSVEKRLSEGIKPGLTMEQIHAIETLGRHEHFVAATPGIQAERSFGPIQIPDDHFFVMGDNRDMSADSRVFGFVPRHLLIGRGTHVVLSFDPENWHLPRIDRIWHEMR